ncbi:hypothetical protein Sden_1700 [Shewanella denitrificans OS217]|jgi:hypothetical protein|uniref:Uncharacterized protein n=1 Tax=Shewanella denitrificans (strain OS217 / ATCC BAA-1090 / DSM 15013) TaxID=318161 RepID=Q12NJ2_SHEDO|nr:hypothetical protein [Shewanella denitrificans]ABE54984.1 hypothetical protein Sden_1700 [Shewanella denitrificans OS217]
MTIHRQTLPLKRLMGLLLISQLAMLPHTANAGFDVSAWLDEIIVEALGGGPRAQGGGGMSVFIKHQIMMHKRLQPCLGC